MAKFKVGDLVKVIDSNRNPAIVYQIRHIHDGFTPTQYGVKSIDSSGKQPPIYFEESQLGLVKAID